MKSHCHAAAQRGFSPACISHACKFTALTLACLVPCAVARAQSADIKAADTKPGNEIYQTLYLTNLTQQSDLNEILNDLRNMLSNAHLYGMPSQNAISIRATPEARNSTASPTPSTSRTAASAPVRKPSP